MNNDKTKSGQRNGPARIDEFPYDVSPFGVRHMGGLAIEWTSTVNFAGNVIMRGGGLFATEAWCRAATRYAHAPERLGVQFGFRIALTAEGERACEAANVLVLGDCSGINLGSAKVDRVEADAVVRKLSTILLPSLHGRKSFHDCQLGILLTRETDGAELKGIVRPAATA